MKKKVTDMKRWERLLIVLMIGLLSANLIIGQLYAKASDELNQSIIDPAMIAGTDVQPSIEITPEDIAPIPDPVETTEEAPAEEVAEETAENTETPEVTDPSEDTLSAEEENPEEELPTEPQILTYGDETTEVIVTVAEAEPGIIPVGATLSVTPIVAENPETQAQYEEVEQKLNEKAEGEEYDIAGFLAYDIKLIDSETGTEVEPNGEVMVSMMYNAPAIATEAEETVESEAALESTTDLDVTVMHLEENTAGEVTEVVDLAKVEENGTEENKIETIDTNSENAVEEMTFEASSFSVYTIIWTYYNTTTTMASADYIIYGEVDGQKYALKNDGTAVAIADAVSQNVDDSMVWTYTGGKLRNKANTGIYVSLANNAVAGSAQTALTVTAQTGYEDSYQIKGSGDTYLTFANGKFSVGNRGMYIKCAKLTTTTSQSLYDLHWNRITPQQYQDMEIVDGNIPITWTRSNITYQQNNITLNWQWESLMSKLGENTLTITDPDQIWDGSRSRDGGNTSYHNYSSYLSNNQISVYNQGGVRKIYDSATWTRGSYDTYTRFRGSFNLKNFPVEEGYELADYDFTVKTVIASLDSHIYINDNMYVFVYPADVTVNNENFLRYCAFWTGTSNQNTSSPVVFGSGPLAKTGTLAYHSGGNATLGHVTDYWYANPVSDGAGGIIQEAINRGYTGKFYIDVIAIDNAGGGGMYKPMIDAKITNPKVEFECFVVDENKHSNGIQNAQFIINGANGYSAPLTTDSNGRIKIKLPAGTYTLKQSAAGGGYDSTTITWTIKVANGSFTMTKNSGGDNKSNLGNFSANDPSPLTAAGDTTAKTNSYYITNKRLSGVALLSLKEQFVNSSGEKVAAPENVGNIKMQIHEYYAPGTQYAYDKVHDVILYKNSDGTFSTTLQCQSYTEFEIVENSQQVFDTEGNDITATVSLLDSGFTRYEDCGISVGDIQRDCSYLERGLTMQNASYVAIKRGQGGNDGYLIISHKNTTPDSVIENIKKAVKDTSNLEITEVVDITELSQHEFLGNRVTFATGTAGSSVLTFSDQKDWAWFLSGSLDISNMTINGYANSRLTSIDITVTERWIDADNLYEVRPETVSFKLMVAIPKSAMYTLRADETEEADDGEEFEYVPYDVDNPDGIYTMTIDNALAEDANTWQLTLSGLNPECQYCVAPCDVDQYESMALTSMPYTVDNNMSWSITKVSAIDGGGLAGGEYELKDASGKVVATAISNSEGTLEWELTGVSSWNDINGAGYTLVETKAPYGYALAGGDWKLHFNKGVLYDMQGDNMLNSDDNMGIGNKDAAQKFITGNGLVNLPSTGGIGTTIFFVIGIAILALASSLLIFRKRAVK